MAFSSMSPTGGGVSGCESGGPGAGPQCPLACGWGPDDGGRGSAVPTLSPCVWGWTGDGVGGARGAGNVPTRVGVDRQASFPALGQFECPHACGGGPNAGAFAGFTLEMS